MRVHLWLVAAAISFTNAALGNPGPFDWLGWDVIGAAQLGMWIGRWS